MTLLEMTILGDPIPKGRPRSTAGHVYTPRRTADEEERVRQLINIRYRQPPCPDPVGIEVTFFCATRRRTDFDNLLKLLTDAAQRGRRGYGGVILDDSQIEHADCWVVRADPDEKPRTQLRIYRLTTSGATPREISQGSRRRGAGPARPV